MFEHTEYHPFTLTGRPSNHFNNINYAALNKEDGSRKRFVSRNDKGFLFEVDLTGFHLYLIYLIIGKPFPSDPYKELSHFYEPNLDPKSYTFKQIYGGVDDYLREVEPFKSIINLQQSIYETYKQGNLKTFLFGRPITIQGLSQTKLFNYMLQNLETEFNAGLINDLTQRLDGKNTKLILYTYDSFLFDYSPKDTPAIIKSILETFKEIPFHLKAGFNYHELKQINL
jgi:hypothetical protein